MAEADLWEKCAAIKALTAGEEEEPVDFGQMAKVFARVLGCGVYLVGRRGRILGWSIDQEGGEQPDIEKLFDYAERFPESFNQELLSLSEPLINKRLNRKCVFRMRRSSCTCRGKVFTVLPIRGGRTRLATLILYRRDPEFSQTELVLAEVAVLTVANEIMYLKSQRQQRVNQGKASLQAALSAVSQSEKEALDHLLSELKGREGIVVASRIADRVGLTRSVMASALRKFESAGIIESRSLGMKGTYIKVLVDNIVDELRK